MLVRLPTSKAARLLVVIAIIGVIFLQNQTVSAELMSPNSGCADLVLVFARGSGQNNLSQFTQGPLTQPFSEKEPEAYSFFNWHREHIQNEYPNITFKAVSVHDFPGKYDPVGYKAVSVFPQVDNLANAEASWIPGDYNDSVQHGVAETVGYLKDQIASCPDQAINIGGYSQGAQVVGDSLFQLTPQEREHISGVGLVGDPKYIGSSGDSHINPFDKPISYAWRRGTATNNDRGMLDARIPYVPSDMEKKLTSWCSNKDPICAGWSAANKDYRLVHSSYSAEPIRNTVNELMMLAAPKLTVAERNRGGLSTEAGVTTLSAADRDRERDVMFVFNDNSNRDVISTFRYSLDPMLHFFTLSFNNTRYAAKSMGENDYGFSAPRVDNVQSFLPYAGYNPANLYSASNLTMAFASKYPFGNPLYGGGDNPDPYQIGLERAITSSGWRNEDVEKNVILIVDRPPKDPYEYNICNGVVRQWLHYPDVDGYKNCYTNFIAESWQKVLLPESCETALLVITSEICDKPLKSASMFQYNKRTLDDTVKIAQSYGVKISIIIPHKMTDSYNDLSKESVRNKLRNIAYATGGTYLYYDQKTEYDGTALHDTLYQVFTKPVRSLSLQSGNKETGSKVLSAKVGSPILFDVSQSGITGQTYNWDFDGNGSWDETTDGPVTEHTYDLPQSGFVKVQAQLSDQTMAETSLVAVVEQDQANEPVELPVVPTSIAQRNQGGSITITWQLQALGELVITDPSTGLPIGNVPLSEGGITLPAPADYESLEIRVIGEQATSDPVTIPVPPFTPDTLESPLEDVVTEDPTLCYKLQQCNQEPNPNYFDPQPHTGVPPATPLSSTVVLANTQTENTHFSISNPVVYEATETPKVAGVSNTNQPAELNMIQGSKKFVFGQVVSNLIALILCTILVLVLYTLSKRHNLSKK